MQISHYLLSGNWNIISIIDFVSIFQWKKLNTVDFAQWLDNIFSDLLYIHVCVCVCMNIRTHIYMYTHIQIYMYTLYIIYIYIYMYICLCTCIYIQIVELTKKIALNSWMIYFFHILPAVALLYKNCKEQETINMPYSAFSVIFMLIFIYDYQPIPFLLSKNKIFWPINF